MEMTISDIQTLVASNESRTLELKKSTGELKDGMHSACAFLKVIAMHFDGWVWGDKPRTFRGCPYYKVENTTMVMPREVYDECIRAHKPKDKLFSPRRTVGRTVGRTVECR